MWRLPAGLGAPARRALDVVPARPRSAHSRPPGRPPWKPGPRPAGRPGGAELQRLREDELPPAPRREVLFGLAPCALALRAARRSVARLLLLEAAAGARAGLAGAARARGVPVQLRRRRELDALCRGQVHQGVCMEVSPLLPTAWPRGPGGPGAPAGAPGGRRLWLLLERIQDPRNLGAVLRSAHFLGVDKVLTSRTDSCPLTPVVSKASAGAMEVMEVFATDDLPGLLRDKIGQGWLVAGTMGCPGQGILTQCSDIPIISCLDFLWDRSTVLVLGNEGSGLSHEVRSLCHIMLTIPTGQKLIPEVESLNVSVAAGILLYSIISQRKGQEDLLKKETSAVARGSLESSASSEAPEPRANQDPRVWIPPENTEPRNRQKVIPNVRGQKED
ncbi:rRNA methyltransferase 1, mitochondrial [Macrotis lagotis]|uniref:rRNA methyltransferase 1, mitochondrial n=1 Tax=Macrotis lagotis TaxID=92651 RepID=UPI003D68B976